MKRSTKTNYSSARSNTFSILLGMAILIFVSVASFSLGLSKGSGNLINPIRNSSPSITPIPSVRAPCRNNILGISIQPDYLWTCETRDLSASEGIIFLKSKIFEVTISNLNRNAFCVGDPALYGYNSSCQISKFYSKPNLNLDLYKFDAINKEIFGNILSAKNPPDTPIPWVLIKYNDIESRNLNEEEIKMINQLLDTIKSL